MPTIGIPELFIVFLIFFVLYGAAHNGGRRSNYRSSRPYSRHWDNPGRVNRPYSYYRNTDESSEVKPPPELGNNDPYAVLNVSRYATDAEITASYRKLVQMYHPDKVEGLAPEYRVIAEQRTKAINASYKQVKLVRGLNS
jgi:DnaJ-domain-containing protein 1